MGLQRRSSPLLGDVSGGTFMAFVLPWKDKMTLDMITTITTKRHKWEPDSETMWPSTNTSFSSPAYTRGRKSGDC